MSLFFTTDFEHHSKAWWRNNNPVLPEDRIGVECDSVDSEGNPVFAIDPNTGYAQVRMKIGPVGGKPWNDIDYTEVFFLSYEMLGATAKGDPGDAATIAVPEVATGEPGTEVEIVNLGTPHAAKWRIIIPRGRDGKDGTIRIADVVTGEPGTPADVEVIGTGGDVALRITIPRGPKGDPGRDGVLLIDDVVIAEPGTPPSLVKGADERWVLTMPAARDGEDGEDGEDGVSPTLQIGQTYTVESDESAKVENVGTDTDQVLDLYLPRGPRGFAGPPGEGVIARWSPEATYLNKCLVWGDDDRLYEWLEASGVDTWPGPQNPTAPPTVPGSTELTPDLGTLPAALKWCSVAYGNGVWVAVAENSSQAAWSADGKKWNIVDLGFTGDWRSVTYGNGRFVAVALGSNIAMYSADGKAWTQTALPSSGNWAAVCWGGDKFVAVQFGSTAGGYSYDGTAWAGMTLPTAANWYCLAYGDGRFVALAESLYNSKFHVAYSDTGTAWTAVSVTPPLYNNTWYNLAYGNGKFYAVNSDSYGGKVAVSADKALSWTFDMTLDPGVNGLRTWRGLTFTGNKFYIACAGTQTVRYSGDFVTWTDLPNINTGDWRGGCFGGGRYITVGYAQAKALVVTETAVEGRPCWKSFDPAAGNDRIILTANTTYYLSATGNDANDGTAAAKAKGTWAGMHALLASIDPRGYTVTVKVSGMIPGDTTFALPQFGPHNCNLVGTSTATDGFTGTMTVKAGGFQPDKISFNVLIVQDSGDIFAEGKTIRISSTANTVGIQMPYGGGRISFKSCTIEYTGIFSALAQIYASTMWIRQCTFAAIGNPTLRLFFSAGQGGRILGTGNLWTGDVTLTEHSVSMSSGGETSIGDLSAMPGGGTIIRTNPGNINVYGTVVAFAQISAAGAITTSAPYFGITSVTKIDIGSYEIRHAISNRKPFVSVAISGPVTTQQYVGTQSPNTTTSRVYIASNGAAADLPFFFIVF